MFELKYLLFLVRYQLKIVRRIEINPFIKNKNKLNSYDFLKNCERTVA